MSGCSDGDPEPVVVGGPAGVLTVFDGEEPRFAVVLLLFQPATIKKPISNNTATPAIQPHIPPALSSRRSTGSLKRGSGSVKRGSVIAILLGSGRSHRLEQKKPAKRQGGSEKCCACRNRGSSGHSDREAPGCPKNEEERGEECRQARSRGPMLDGSTNAVRNCFADQYKNDIDSNQFHWRARSVPRTHSIGRMHARGEGISVQKML